MLFKPYSKLAQGTRPRSYLEEAFLIVVLRQSLLDCLTCTNEEDINIQFTSSEEQIDIFSSLDDLDAVKAVVPIGLDGVLTDEERKLYDLLGSPKPGARLNDLEGSVPSVQELVSSTEDAAMSNGPEEQSTQEPLYAAVQALKPPHQVLVLTFSCIAALLAMSCIGLGLYAWHYFRKTTMEETAWEMIPRVETRDAVELVLDEDFAGRLRDKKPLLWQDIPLEAPPNAVPPPFNARDEEALFSPHPQQRVINLDSDNESDEEDFEEKFHDAEDKPFYFVDVTDREKTEVPIILVEEQPAPDPDYLPLPVGPAFQLPTPYSTPPPTPPRSPHKRIVEMREANIVRPSSPVSKPAWSLRASDAPALGFSSADARAAPVPLPLPLPSRPTAPVQAIAILPIPGALTSADLDADPEMQMQMVEHEKPRSRRAYRTPVPELDIAFAMQLRPGLGLGSDPAWIVRFLMAMFGWMTVLIGNGGTLVTATVRRERRAIA